MQNVDDVGFLRQLIETLSLSAAIDRERVFACGISNGGLMSFLHIPGTADPLVPYQGGQIMLFGQQHGPVLSAAETEARWVSYTGAAPVARVSALPDLDAADGTRAVRRDHASTGARVSVITVGQGGHCWPGGHQDLPRFVIGRTSNDFSAGWAIGEFFGLNRYVP